MGLFRRLFSGFNSFFDTMELVDVEFCDSVVAVIVSSLRQQRSLPGSGCKF